MVHLEGQNDLMEITANSFAAHFSTECGEGNVVNCYVGDHAGDFAISVYRDGEGARAFFSIREAKRLLSVLKSGGGSRFDSEYGGGAITGATAVGGLVAKTTKAGIQLIVTEGQDQVVVVNEAGGVDLVGSQHLYPPVQVTVGAADKFIITLERLLGTMPPDFSDGPMHEDWGMFAEELDPIVAEGRYGEARKLFHKRRMDEHKKREEEHEVWLASLPPEELARVRENRKAVLARMLEALRAPL